MQPILLARWQSALRLAHSASLALSQTLLWFVLIVAFAEGLVRTPALWPFIGRPDIHSPNPYFNAEINQLEQAAASGPIECIVLGSSMVYMGFQPADFAAAYQRETQTNLTCYRMGVPGLTAEHLGVLIRLLVTTYHPKLVILGANVRDYSDSITALNWGRANDLAAVPWVEYKLGEPFNWEGWLIDHSLAFRHSLDFRVWMQAPTAPVATEPLNSEIDLSQPPDPVADRFVYDVFADYTVSPAGMAGLDEVLGIQQQGVAVYVVEMPVHPTFLYYLPHGEGDQALFRKHVGNLVAVRGSQFWLIDQDLKIPDAGWLDRQHLNVAGGRLFSVWLAHKLAEAPEALLPPPVR